MSDLTAMQRDGMNMLLTALIIKRDALDLAINSLRTVMTLSCSIPSDDMIEPLIRAAAKKNRPNRVKKK